MVSNSGVALATYTLCLASSVLAPSEGPAMEFKLVEWRSHQVLRANGEIIKGDASALAKWLPALKPLPYGLPVILLNSPGGNVDEALRISELLTSRWVHTVVPSGARCASACASIFFIAGKDRTVEEGGLLGQHSCSVGGIKDQQCNDTISANAIAQGVSHGSIAAFITYADPSEMIWFDRELADCNGITRYPFETESGFNKSEPCVIKVITGHFPPAQSAWRVDFEKDGYRAFLRPALDHLRELELSLYCNDQVPSTLSLYPSILTDPPRK